MKKLNRIVYGLLCLLVTGTTAALTSCRDETDTDVFFAASEADVVLQYDGLTDKNQPGQFDLGANREWRLTSKPDWVTLSHESGHRGRLTLYVTAGKNTTGEDREGFLEFELDNGKPEQVAVYQYHLPEKVAVTGTRHSVNILGLDADGKAPVVHVSSNYGWKITVPDSCTWIKPSATKGDAGDVDVTLNVEANDTKAARTGNLVFTAGKSVYTLTVSQDARVFTLPATAMTLSKNGNTTLSGGENVFTINAVEGWTVSSQPEWATCTPSTGKAGTTRLTVTASVNNTGAVREGRIVLTSAHGVEAVLTLSQENKAVLLPDDRAVGYVYFAEPFDWAHAFALQNPGTCQDQVGSTGGSDGKTTAIYGNATCMENFSKMLTDYNAKGKCIYVADGYLKIGKGNNQSGVTLGSALDIPEGRKANVIVSFDIADNKTDKTTIVVEVSGDGTVVGGQSPTLSKPFTPIQNSDASKAWQWSRRQEVEIDGVTANTKLSIRSSQQNTSGYYRWFLDNIKVTRTTTNK